MNCVTKMGKPVRSYFVRYRVIGNPYQSCRYSHLEDAAEFARKMERELDKGGRLSVRIFTSPIYPDVVRHCGKSSGPISIGAICPSCQQRVRPEEAFACEMVDE